MLVPNHQFHLPAVALIRICHVLLPPPIEGLLRYSNPPRYLSHRIALRYQPPPPLARQLYSQDAIVVSSLGRFPPTHSAPPRSNVHRTKIAVGITYDSRLAEVWFIDHQVEGAKWQCNRQSSPDVPLVDGREELRWRRVWVVDGSENLAMRS